MVLLYLGSQNKYEGLKDQLNIVERWRTQRWTLHCWNGEIGWIFDVPLGFPARSADGGGRMWDIGRQIGKFLQKGMIVCDRSNCESR